MKKSLLILISLFIIIFILNVTNRKDTAISYAALNQNIGDIYDQEYTYNITSIKLEEIENKGVMIEFKLSFKVEAGQIDKITFSNYKESCIFDEVYVVSTDIYNLTCKIENLNYDTNYDGGDIEFVLNRNSINIQQSINSFKTRSVNPEALLAVEQQAQNDYYFSYIDYEKLKIDKEDKYQIQQERLTNELDEFIEKMPNFNMKVFDRELAYERVVTSDQLMNVDLSELESTVNRAKEDISNKLTGAKTYNTKIKYEIDYGGHTMKLEKSVTIILTYRQSSGELDLKSMLSSVLSLLGISTDPNVPSKYTSLKSFSGEAYKFVKSIHGALSVIAMSLCSILIIKKVIEKTYATKKVNYTDVIKYILLLIVVKVIIDNSLWIVNAIYAFVVKLISIIGAIDLSMLPGASIGDVYEIFAYDFWNDVTIWNFMQKIATSGTQMTLYLLGLILMLVYYVLFALIILYACVVIIKRYIHILIYAIMMPLTICFFLDEKLNIIAKNHLKQLFIHLLSGVTLTISIYFMILIGSVFSSIEIIQDAGADEFQIIIKWGFAIAAPVVMFMTIKASKNITEKIIGG